MTKLRTELKNTKELDNRRAKVAMGSRELIRCCQDLQRRLQKVNNGLSEETRRSLDVTAFLKRN